MHRLLALFVVFSIGCSADDAGLTKGDVEDALGKGDTTLVARLCRDQGLPPDCDPCLAMGWYDDDECDAFCPTMDPACVDCTAYHQYLGECLAEELSYAACTDNDMPASDEPLVEGSASAQGVLAFVNDPATTFAVLDDEAGLDRRAATNIIAHRDGPDGQSSTEDDDLYDTLAELDGVSWVGPATLDLLLRYADSHGYVQTNDLETAGACCQRWDTDYCGLVDPQVRVTAEGLALPEALSVFDHGVTFGLMDVNTWGERFSPSMLNTTFARGKNLFGSRCDGVLYNGTVEWRENGSMDSLFNFYRGNTLSGWSIAMSAEQINALDAYINSVGRQSFRGFYASDSVDHDCVSGRLNYSLIWNVETDKVIYMVMYTSGGPPVPELSNVALSITDARTATVTFDLSEPSSAELEISRHGSEAPSVIHRSEESLTSHSIELTDLEPLASYSFVVRDSASVYGPFDLFMPAEATATFRVLFDQAHAQTAGQANWTVDDNGPNPLPEDPTGPDDWNGGYSSFAYELYEAGRYEILVLLEGEELTYGEAGPVDLSTINLLVVPEPNINFTAQEQDAIVTYVQNGGGLLLIANHSGSDRNNDGMDSRRIWNALATDNTVASNPFSLTVNSHSFSGPSVSTLSQDPLVPVLDGPYGTVSEFSFHAGATLSAGTGAAHIIPLAWEPGHTGSDARIVLCAGVFGAGRFVAIGDSAPLADGTTTSGGYDDFKDSWDENNNRALFLNGAAWLVGE